MVLLQPCTAEYDTSTKSTPDFGFPASIHFLAFFVDACRIFRTFSFVPAIGSQVSKFLSTACYCQKTTLRTRELYGRQRRTNNEGSVEDVEARHFARFCIRGCVCVKLQFSKFS